jgi:hypothetical protein
MHDVLTIENKEDFFAKVAHFQNPVSDDSLTVICAGHFILMPDETKEKVVPSFMLNSPVVGLFPQYTWELGCALAYQQSQKPGTTKLSLLINDWQAVPNDPNRLPDAPNGYRETFYNSFTDLPQPYKIVFDSYGFDREKDMYHTKAGTFYIKETALRDRFARNHKNISLSSCDGISCGQDKEIIHSPDNSHKVILIDKNGRPQCAGEIAQMILDITHGAKNFDQVNFINLMPEGCKHPVNAGSMIALDALRQENIGKPVQIENIFFNAHGINDPDLFYALSSPVELYRHTL